VTQSSGNPTRLHQQLEKLNRNITGPNRYEGSVVESGYRTTGEAKAAEQARLDQHYQKTGGAIPPGNRKSYRPPPKKGR